MEQRSQHDSPNALLQHGNVKVHQKAGTSAGQFEVAHHLRDMNGMNLLNGLDFNNKPAGNEEINPLMT